MHQRGGKKALVRFSAGLAGIALISSVVCMCLINGAEREINPNHTVLKWMWPKWDHGCKTGSWTNPKLTMVNVTSYYTIHHPISCSATHQERVDAGSLRRLRPGMVMAQATGTKGAAAVRTRCWEAEIYFWCRSYIPSEVMPFIDTLYVIKNITNISWEIIPFHTLVILHQMRVFRIECGLSFHAAAVACRIVPCLFYNVIICLFYPLYSIKPCYPSISIHITS